MPKQLSTSQPPAEPDLAGAVEDLEVLAQKPKKISPEEVVATAFEQIDTALKRGYSFSDIAKVFTKRHIRISAKELKMRFETALKASGGEKPHSI